MPIDGTLIERIGGLETVITDVATSVNGALGFRNVDGDIEIAEISLSIDRVEASVDRWLRESDDIETRLMGYQFGTLAERRSSHIRLGGFMMLHLAAAEDVALVSRFDDVSNEIARSAIDALLPPGPAAMIFDVALGSDGEPGLLSSMSNQGDHDFDEDDNVDESPDDDGSDRDLLDLGGPTDEVDEVVKDIVDRAGKAGTSVVLGLSGANVHSLAAGPLSLVARAAHALPEDIRSTFVGVIKRVAGAVARLIKRARDLLKHVLGRYTRVADDVIHATDPQSLIRDAISSHVVGVIVGQKHVRETAIARLDGIGRRTRERRLAKIRDLKASHWRWVGPVRRLGGGLHHLWAVQIGPVPTAPIAAVALLAWTVLITGDQLDSPGFYPDLWKGVVRRASGE